MIYDAYFESFETENCNLWTFDDLWFSRRPDTIPQGLRNLSAPHCWTSWPESESEDPWTQSDSACPAFRCFLVAHWGCQRSHFLAWARMFGLKGSGLLWYGDLACRGYGACPHQLHWLFFHQLVSLSFWSRAWSQDLSARCLSDSLSKLWSAGNAVTRGTQSNSQGSQPECRHLAKKNCFPCSFVDFWFFQ